METCSPLSTKEKSLSVISIPRTGAEIDLILSYNEEPTKACEHSQRYGFTTIIECCPPRDTLETVASVPLVGSYFL